MLRRALQTMQLRCLFRNHAAVAETRNAGVLQSCCMPCSHQAVSLTHALLLRTFASNVIIKHNTQKTIAPIGGFDRLRALPPDVPPDLDVPVPPFCAGCGVKLQNMDEDALG